MFIDHQEKISPARKWFSRLLKLTFFLFALLAIFVTVLANMGGSSDMLKSSTEKFIGDIFGGKPAYIQTLVRLSFFPMVGLDIEKVQVTKPVIPGSDQKAEILAAFSKVRFFVDFWDFVFSKPRFKMLLVEDGYLSKGMIGEKNLTLERAYVDQDESKNEANIVANGLYGKNEWKLTAGVVPQGFSGKYSYEIGEKTPFTFVLGDLNFSGTLVKSNDHFLKMEAFKLMIGGEQKMAGDLYASMISPEVIKMRGSINIKDNTQPNIKFDLLFNFKDKPMKVSGDLSGESFAFDEIYGKDSLRSVFNHIYGLVREGKISEDNAQAFAGQLSASDLDMDVHLKDVIVDKSRNAEWSMHLRQKSGDLSLEGIKGKVGEKSFDVPALAVVQKDGLDKASPQFYGILVANDLTFPVFDLLGPDLGKTLKGVQDETQKIGCASARLFDDETNILRKINIDNKDTKPFIVSVADYAFLGTIFDTVQKRACLSVFQPETISAPATEKP